MLTLQQKRAKNNSVLGQMGQQQNQNQNMDLEGIQTGTTNINP